MDDFTINFMMLQFQTEETTHTSEAKLRQPLTKKNQLRMKKCSVRRNQIKMALGFKRGYLNLQTYRTTTVSSQLVHNVLPHIIVDSFNNLEGQY
jgi:hypothetical protein